MTAARDFNLVAGVPFALAEDLQMVLAPNPSPMTYLGTNTYLLGRDRLAIIDPGPADAAHLSALLEAIGGRPVSHIFVTHAHLDHAPLARPLSERTGAPVLAFGAALAGRSEMMQALARDGLAGGGEGIDATFAPDVCMGDGATVTDAWGTMTAIHTPGHIGNHLCFAWGTAIFTGDHVMGWASSLVSPPDGDLGDFMLSCAKLQKRQAQIFYPAHGAPVLAPAARLAWLVAHRQERESQILDALRQGPATSFELTRMVYAGTPASLQAAAARNVFAHLVDLYQRGELGVHGHLSPDATVHIKGVETARE